MPKIYPKYTNPDHDARRKIHPNQHPQIIATYRELGSLQRTADHFGISKRLVHIIVSPEAKRTIQNYQKKNQAWLKYYKKDKHTIAMRKYREKKKKLLTIKSGL